MKNYSRGFTLVEMLVGLTLFGFILTMLYSAMFSLGNALRVGDMQAKSNDNHRLGESFLRRTLSQTTAIIFLDGKNNNVMFHGQADSLSFISYLPSYLGGTGLYAVTLFIAEEAGESNLELRYQPLVNIEDINWERVSSDNQIVMKNVAAIQFEFYGKKMLNDGSKWYYNWIANNELPSLVKINIKSSEPHHKWPEIMVKIASESSRMRPHLTLVKKQ